MVQYFAVSFQVFRQLLPVLLMLGENGSAVSATPLPSHLVTCSRHSLAFVEYISSKSREEFSGPLLKLLQHMCCKVPDKAEYRNRVAPVSVSSVGVCVRACAHVHVSVLGIYVLAKFLCSSIIKH